MMRKNGLVEGFTGAVPVHKHAEAVHPAYVLDVKFVDFQIAVARLALISQGMPKIRVSNQFI